MALWKDLIKRCAKSWQSYQRKRTNGTSLWIQSFHEHMMSIVKEISHIREEARLMIQKVQDRMIQQTPGKERRFIVDEEVLCRDSAKKSWYSGKLEPKWKGPYQIAAVLLNGSYKIADQGGVLRTPVNGDRLKLYNWRSLELIVIIENI